MENKKEILKKLGFQDDFLLYIEDSIDEVEISDKDNREKIFEEISVYPSEISNPIIDKTKKPISYFVDQICV